MKKITLLAAFFIAAFSNALFAQIVTSELDNGSDGTLRQEISDTPAGGIITFSPSITSITLSSELVINKDLTISGLSTSKTSINANSLGRAFKISNASVTFNNLKIINGIADNGGAVHLLNADLEINECILSNNTANGSSGSGGAIYIDSGASVVINNSDLLNNIANRAGGAIEDNSGSSLAIQIFNSTINGNNAGMSPATPSPGNGGAIHVTGSGNVSINSSLVQNNIAAAEGGGLWNGVGNMTLDSTIVENNIANGDLANEGGGGVFNSGGTLIIKNSSEINYNEANGISGSGGGIFNDVNGVLTITNSEVIGNNSNRAGGGIEDNSSNSSIVNLTNVILDDNITSNTPGNGGGLHVTGNGDVNISGGTVKSNLSGSEGGGLWNGSGTMTIDGVEIGWNIASGDNPDQGGGGIFNSAGNIMILNQSYIHNNKADGISGSGGGIFNDVNGNLTINNSEISNNESNRAGGGIEDNSSSTTTIYVNNTIFDNNTSAGNPGNGGGIHITGDGNSEITGGTFSNNTSSAEGGALWNGTGSMIVDGVTINGNIANGNNSNQGGGGIYNLSGNLTIKNSTQIINNKANGTSGSGGGILNDISGTLNITNSEVSGNEANRAGGGIEDMSMSNTTTILDNVTLNGNHAINAPGNGGGLHITGDGNINITGGTINNNTAGIDGGGLWNGSGVMTIDGTTIDGNLAEGGSLYEGGGGIYNEDGDLFITNSTKISNNNANGAQGTGGGVLNKMGSVTIIDSEISSNQSRKMGGGIADLSDSSTITKLTNSNLNNNVVLNSPNGGLGGGLFTSSTSIIEIFGGTINSNIAGKEGGGLWNFGGEMTIDNALIDSNIANSDTNESGGGIYNLEGILTIQNNTIISNNIALGLLGSGGGILNDSDGKLIIKDSEIVNNISNTFGGGIETKSNNNLVEITNVLFDGNSAGKDSQSTANPGDGGAIHVSGSGDILILNSKFTNNGSANFGGALYNNLGISTVKNSTFDNNASDNYGGAIYNKDGELDIVTSTISRNESTLSGGGIFNDNGQVFLTRSTIAENTSGDNGGGIYNNGDLDMNAVTIAYNTSTNNGGGVMSMVNVNLKNSIIAENMASIGKDASGSFTSQGYNLIGNDDEATYQAANGDVVDMNPNLGPLQNYGGLTETVALLSGSVCVDAGDSIDIFNDQREFLISNSRDMGAFEYEGFLGVDDTQEIELSTIYPNPSTGQITIGISNSIAADNIKLSVYSMAGNLVYQSSLIAGDNPVNLNNLNTGVYLLNINSNNKSQSHKLIIN